MLSILLVGRSILKKMSRRPQNSNDTDSEEGDDRLRSIHAELEKTSNQKPSSPWLPLESNPTIFTSFARRLGLHPDWSFVDVLGFDDELLQLVPRPVAAVILLFPTTEKIYAARAEEKKRLLADIKGGDVSEVVRGAYHVEQVASFGNACGTIACTHALTNADLNGGVVGEGAALTKFRAATENGTSRERGSALVADKLFHNLSDEAATDQSAQTTCPDRGDTYLGHHYCCLVPIHSADGTSDAEARIIELDGTKVSPVDHGPVGNRDFLSAAAEVVKERWLKLEPDRIDFVLMALSKTDG